MILVALALLLVPQQRTVIGDWKGTSICKANKPVCKDEVVIYHFKPVAGKDSFELQADKVVNGVPQDMGTLTCDVNATTRTVTCPMPPQFRPGLWKFSWRGDGMSGTLTEKGGKLVRVISVTRSKSK